MSLFEKCPRKPFLLDVPSFVSVLGRTRSAASETIFDSQDFGAAEFAFATLIDLEQHNECVWGGVSTPFQPEEC